MIGFDGGKKRRKEKKEGDKTIFPPSWKKRIEEGTGPKREGKPFIVFSARAFEFFSLFFVGATQPKLIKDTEKSQSVSKKYKCFGCLA